MIDRDFDLYEKLLAKKINNDASLNPKSLCEMLRDHYFTDKALLFDQTNRRVALFVDAKLFNSAQSYRKDVAKFWLLFDMIEYLSENGYMTVMPYSSTTKPGNVNVVWKDCTGVNIQNGQIMLNQTDVWKGLDITRNGNLFLKGIQFPPQYYDKLEAWFGDAYSLPKFGRLIANDFQSDETIRNKKGLFWARIAGILAGLSFLVAFVSFFVQQCTQCVS